MFDKPKIPSHNCTGCGACKNVCRHNCITMIEDEKGFYYPIIDKSICVNCKACIHVCPVINTSPKREIHQTYACKNLDEKVRLSSTSGGLFTAIANYVIDRGGVVIGACFDKDWNVRHEYAETKEDVVKFKGSKYVQSEVSHIYPVLKNFLKEKRLVLFSGTPCQVAGIRSFLHRDYDNLILLDFICHGVPSRKVWKKYLNDECGLSYNKELELNRNDGCSIIGGTIYDRPIIQSINFRNKKTGWQNYSFSLTLSNVSADGGQKTVSHSMIAWNHPYMKGFIGSLYLRPSCYSCPMKGFRSNSDFTLADAWAILR